MPFVGHKDEVTSVAFHNLEGEEVIVSSSIDQTIKIWNIDTQKVIHSMPVPYSAYDLSLSKNGSIVASFGKYVANISINRAIIKHN